MVLNTRDIEDSGTIFGFLVSIHTKKCWTFEIFLSKIGPIWRFGHLEPLCGSSSSGRQDDAEQLPGVPRRF